MAHGPLGDLRIQGVVFLQDAPRLLQVSSRMRSDSTARSKISGFQRWVFGILQNPPQPEAQGGQGAELSTRFEDDSPLRSLAVVDLEWPLAKALAQFRSPTMADSVSALTVSLRIRNTSQPYSPTTICSTGWLLCRRAWPNPPTTVQPPRRLACSRRPPSRPTTTHAGGQAPSWSLAPRTRGPFLWRQPPEAPWPHSGSNRSRLEGPCPPPGHVAPPTIRGPRLELGGPHEVLHLPAVEHVVDDVLLFLRAATVIGRC